MNEDIKEKLKLKIAISEIKKEENAMKKGEKIIFKNLGIAACMLILFSGVVFAGSKVVEKIWKTPQKIEISNEITEEVKSQNISLEEAKTKAIEILQKIGFSYNITNYEENKDYTSNRIVYTFFTDENFEISINGLTGEFYDLWNNNLGIQDRNIEITKEEAIEEANKYYKLFGFKEGEYEITKVWVNNNEGSGDGSGFKIDITYSKKYGDVFNPYQSIMLAIESKNKNLDYFRVENLNFDNNEIVITQDEAMKIALEQDKKITSEKIEKVETKLMIVKMNSDAYERISDIDKYYKEKEASNAEEKEYYSVDERIRYAWVVVITYEDNFGDDIRKRYTEGKYSYFVDSSTGEIIGGHVMDYRSWY